MSRPGLRVDDPTVHRPWEQLRRRLGPVADARAQAGRLAALLFLLAAIYLLVTVPGWAGTGRSRQSLQVGTVACLLTSPVLFLVPWQRWSTKATMLPAVWALLLLGVVVGAWGHQLQHFTWCFTLIFLYLGLTQRRGASLVALPVALLVVWPTLGQLARPERIDLLGALLVDAVLLEIVAMITHRRGRERDRASMFLSATRALHAVETEFEAADVIADLAIDLLGAVGATVLLRLEPGSTVLINANSRHTFGPVGSFRLDTSAGPSGAGACVRAVEPLFIADVGRSTLLRRNLGQHVAAASLLYFPLVADDGPVGVVGVWWTKHRGVVDPFWAQAIEVVGSQAGQALRRLEQAHDLQLQASQDQLTGLLNRRSLFAALDRLEVGDALVLIDLDRFKQVNDVHGHLYGDQVLAAFATLLRGCLRTGDGAYRYGGEEFAIILPGTESAAGQRLLDRAHEAWTAQQDGLSFSAGLAVHTDGSAPTETLAAADNALYEAKSAGRARTEVAAELLRPRIQSDRKGLRR